MILFLVLLGGPGFQGGKQRGGRPQRHQPY